MNSIRQTFGICSVQSLLRETGLYTGKIDGLFGEGCYKAVETVLKDTVERTHNWEAKDIFFNLQRTMVSLGLDTGGVDGIWGNGSQRAMEDTIARYKRNNHIPAYGQAWSGHKNVTASGIQKIIRWLAKHNKPENHAGYVLSCINFETAGTFLPSKENTVSHALGLIQFMPSKLKEWGIDRETFAKLSFDDQLDYVFKFFEEYNYIEKCKSVEDYYLSIFYPAAVGKCPDDVIAKKGTKLYEQNANAFDKTHRGFYTAGDIAKPVVDRYWMGMAPNKRVTVSN